MVATGEAAPEILRLAHEGPADLIVIASHGLAGWQRLVFGSVAEKVMRQATCPVLTKIMAPPRRKALPDKSNREAWWVLNFRVLRLSCTSVGRAVISPGHH